MSFGHLTHEMRRVIRRYVEGRTVVDLGAGDLELARELLDWNPKRLLAVDSRGFQNIYFLGKPATERPKGLELRTCRFADFTDDVDVAFVSWPDSLEGNGLVDIARRAKLVIYLGKNTNGVCCGAPSLFEHLLKREVLAHVPHEANELVVYGNFREADREALVEELGGVDRSKVFWWKGASISLKGDHHR